MKQRIAVIGGTGAEGSGLALRWARAGHRIVVGSRDAAKARRIVETLNALLGDGPSIMAMSNREAAECSDIVVITVPFAAQLETGRELADVLDGKIVVDVTVPLQPPDVSRVQLPPPGSCVVQLQKELGSGVCVVSAFQNVSAVKLKNLDVGIDCDVLVCSDDASARSLIVRLAEDAGLRGVEAGPLVNSTVAEALTAVLIWINRKYKVQASGLRITGL